MSALNRLKQITTHGQSVWLDFTRRSFVEGGELRKLIEEDGLTGVTSNPAILDEAMSRGDEYEADIGRAAERGLPAAEAYEEMAIADIQSVADELRGVYDRTEGRDGFVSLEVSPTFARDTEASLEQAREFWGRVNRPNLFIKIPGTREGLPAIRQLLTEGINVNVTLLFGLSRYRAVVAEYMAALDQRLDAGKPVDRIASVASFFLSRIDLAVDPKLEEIGQKRPDLAERARKLMGKTAIACAKEAYQVFKELHAGERFRRLAAAGARPQRVLWASTSTKRPDERDVRYVEALIGPDTIDTVPRQTLDAFRDHGEAAPRLEEGLEDVRGTLRELGEVGIDLEAVSRQLEEEGIKKFLQPFEHLFGELQRKLGEDLSAPRVRH